MTDIERRVEALEARAQHVVNALHLMAMQLRHMMPMCEMNARHVLKILEYLQGLLTTTEPSKN